MVFDFLRVILNQPGDKLLVNEFKEQLFNIATIRKENNIEWADFLNKLYAPSKEISGTYKKYYSQEIQENRLRDEFVFQLNKYGNNYYNEETIDWTLFEFYGKIYNRYYRNLHISKMKVDPNDKNDLDNMIYVQQADLYWTLEKRWLTIAKEAKVENYLYSSIF